MNKYLAVIAFNWTGFIFLAFCGALVMLIIDGCFRALNYFGNANLPLLTGKFPSYPRRSNLSFQLSGVPAIPAANGYGRASGRIVSLYQPGFRHMGPTNTINIPSGSNRHRAGKEKESFGLCCRENRLSG